jgi:beta-lactamase class A
MRFDFSGRPLLAMVTSAFVLAGCVSGGAIVPPARDARAPSTPSSSPPSSPSRPAGSATRPVGAPTHTGAPVYNPSVDPGFRRPAPGLNERIAGLWRAFPGKTGIAVQRIDGEWALAQRGEELFPQQSVSKLWVVMAVLDAVDRGQISLDQQVRIGPDDLTLFHQPIATRVRSEGAVSMSVRDLIETAITQSDNTANDSLLRTVGGPEAVRRFFARKDLGAIRFGPGERLLQAGTAGLKWQQSYSIGRNFQTARAALPPATRQAAMNAYLADPIDGASPAAIAGALTRLARGSLLSPESTNYLLGVMTRTKSGPRRLKGGLPSDWRFLHKTGTGQDLNGMTAGYNDIGIATAPDGTRYAIVVMMGNTTAPIPARMTMMQAVSGAVAEFHGR